jgi:hypothetical protein
MAHDIPPRELRPDGISRRVFTLEAALGILGACVITIAEDACSSSSPTPTTPTAPPADVNGVVANNHATPHIAIITGAQITAGGAVALNIQGQATHNHTLSITQGDLANLKNRIAITETSSTDSGHSHAVTFTPA